MLLENKIDMCLIINGVNIMKENADELVEKWARRLRMKVKIKRAYSMNKKQRILMKLKT